MGTLRKEFTHGVFWIALAKYSGLLINLLITAILARHVAPAAFGTIAIATVILHFLQIFTDLGIGPAIIQYKELTKQQINSIFTFSIYLGIFLALILFSLSGIIADFYEDSTLIIVCKILAVNLFFYAINIVPNGLMSREKRFRAIGLRTVSIQIICGCIAVWGALHGWDVYALLVTPFFTAIGVFLINFYNYPQRFVARLDAHALKIISSFSVYQFLFSFCNYFSRNLDQLIIGKRFSMAELGYYDKSYRLMKLPLQNVTSVLNPVLHPVLSTLKDDREQLCHKNTKLVTIISNFSFPLGLICYFCAAEIIRLFYGSNWDNAIPVFRILALSLPLQMILSSSGAVYQASGMTKHMFINGILNTICTVIGFVFAAFWGKSIEAMAWAWDITLCINFITSYFIMYRYTFKDSPCILFRAICSQILNSIITCGVMFALLDILPFCSILLTLVIKSFILFIITTLSAYFLKQYNVIVIGKTLLEKTKRNREC